ncbi:MAG: hypothetical protein U5K37_00265 [Natrialbaceae archaeon]|nr:hypothetical protein [Natrialbaceae archaeon]
MERPLSLIAGAISAISMVLILTSLFLAFGPADTPNADDAVSA